MSFKEAILQVAEWHNMIPEYRDEHYEVSKEHRDIIAEYVKKWKESCQIN